VGVLDPQIIEHGYDVLSHRLQAVTGGIVGLIACAVAARVEHDELVIVPHCRDEAERFPVAPTPGEAMLQHQRWPRAFDDVVDAHIPIAGVRHDVTPLHAGVPRGAPQDHARQGQPL
jgi:hypothetical protein